MEPSLKVEEAVVWEAEVLSCHEEVDHASSAFCDLQLASVRHAGQMQAAELEEVVLLV